MSQLRACWILMRLCGWSWHQAAGLAGPGCWRRELAAAGGWVLAEAVKADRDQPPFDRSTRDGYAVRARDLASGGELQVVGQVRAGELWRGAAVASGSAVEIMTGAPVPDGADAVVMMEHVLRDDGAVHLGEGRRVERGENIVLRGVRRGRARRCWRWGR